MEPGPVEEVGLNLDGGDAVADHESEGEDAPGAYNGAVGVVDQSSGAASGGRERSRGVGGEWAVGGQEHTGVEVDGTGSRSSPPTPAAT